MVRVSRSPELEELSAALHKAAFLIGVTEFNRQHSDSDPQELDELADKVLQSVGALLGPLKGKRA